MMLRKCALWCAVGVLVTCLIGCNGEAAKPAVTGDPRIQAPVPAARPGDDVLGPLLKEHRWDEFEQMIVVLGLDESQEKAFRENMADRSAKLDAFRQTDQCKQGAELGTQLRAAERATPTDEAKVAELKAKLAPIAAANRAKMEDLRRIVMGGMSAEQQEYWCRYVLYRDATGRFGKAKLTDAQKDSVWSFCAEHAKMVTAEGYLAGDPYLRGDGMKAAAANVRVRILEEVLTDEQKKLFPPREPKS